MSLYVVCCLTKYGGGGGGGTPLPMLVWGTYSSAISLMQLNQVCYTTRVQKSNRLPMSVGMHRSKHVTLMQTHSLKIIGRLCHAGWTVPQHPQEAGQCPGVGGPVQPPSPVCLGR